MHNEWDKLFWKILQWIPRRHWVRDKDSGRYSLKWDCSPKPTLRHMEEGELIHRAVFERMERDPSYRPVNLPDNVRDDKNAPGD